MSNRNPRWTWIIANAAGLSIGFWSMLQVSNIVEHGQLGWVEGVGEGLGSYLSRFIGVVFCGAVLGSFQSLVLRGNKVPSIRWIFVTTVGFAAITPVEWVLIYTGDWGNLPGPIEPIILLVGGGSLAGFAQYLFLKRRHEYAVRLLTLWIAGLLISLLPTAAVFVLLLPAIGVTLSWPAEVLVNGLLVGGFAAAISSAIWGRTSATV